MLQDLKLAVQWAQQKLNNASIGLQKENFPDRYAKAFRLLKKAKFHYDMAMETFINLLPEDNSPQIPEQ
jgi:hypothetical protein